MIPEEWVKFYKKEFVLFGVKSDEWSRDELLAAIGWLNNSLKTSTRGWPYYIGKDQTGHWGVTHWRLRPGTQPDFDRFIKENK